MRYRWLSRGKPVAPQPRLCGVLELTRRSNDLTAEGRMNAKLLGPVSGPPGTRPQLNPEDALDPSSGAEIADHLARRIVAGRAGDAAAEIGRGTAHETRNWHSVIGVSELGPGRIELVEVEALVEDVAADEV